jgi:asparagine synthase (glutamine-hydrolysing)
VSRIAGSVALTGPAVDVREIAHVMRGSERQPLVCGSVVVCFDGRLDNREELAKSCDIGGTPPSDAAFVVAAYRTFGEACVERLAGDFAFALFDATHQKLLLARDLMAVRPLYYCALPRRIVFASSIATLLAEPDVRAKPDEDGLADLVLNGYFDGHRTWFDGVWGVPPGAIVTATRDGIRVGVAPELEIQDIRCRSFAEYAEHFGAVFTQAVRRRLRSDAPVAVSVSGGVDSSSLHCEATRLKGSTQIRGFTLAFPPGTAADESPFIDVLRTHGCHVESLPVSELRLLTGADESVRGTEMPGLLWDRQDALLSRARATGCRVMLDGYFADQLLAGQAYLVDLAREGRFGTVKRHLDQLPRWLDDEDPRFFRRRFASDVARAAPPAWLMQAARRTIGRARAMRRYPPWFHKRFRERAIERSLDRARAQRRYGSEHARYCVQTATSGHYRAAVQYTTSAAAARQIDAAFPFADRDLVCFIASIPGEIVSHGGMSKALLRHAMKGVAPDSIRLRRSKADFTGFTNRAALAERQSTARLLGADSFAARAGFLDPDVLRSRTTAAFGALANDRSAQLGWDIAGTLGLELWLRRFCGGAHAAGAR